MKKAIISPLSSALVIPGLGQVLNQHLKKGVAILLGVFLLFIITVIKLYLMIKAAMEVADINGLDSGAIMDRLKAEDASDLWYLFVAFVILWSYSVLDAYLTGRKIDQRRERDHQ